MVSYTKSEKKSQSKKKPVRRRFMKSSKKRSELSPYRVERMAKNTVLFVIVLLALLMVFFTFYHLIATPEYLIKKEVEEMTTDYYENYFYPTVLENNMVPRSQVEEAADSEEVLAPILEKYSKIGFSRVTLRQLLIYDNYKNASYKNVLSEYCDLDKTTVKLYPESPFKKENFRAEYTYSCKF